MVSGACATALVGDRLRQVVGPAALRVGVQRHQVGERDLARRALSPPVGPPLLQPVERAVGLYLGRPPVLLAHGQPHRPEAVLEQPVHHVALGEHLRLAGDLVRLDLAAAVELVVERLALGVVPVLVDPAERHVVGPAALQHLGVEGVDDVPERRRRDRDEIGHARPGRRGRATRWRGPRRPAGAGTRTPRSHRRARCPGASCRKSRYARLSQPPVTTAGARSGWPEGPGASMSRSRTSRFSSV